MKPTAGIYTPLGLDGFELCQPVDHGDFERIHVEVNGVSRLSGWDPIRMKIIRNDEGVGLAESDSPWLGSHTLVLKRRAVEAIGGLLNGYGEILPLSCPDADISLYNALHVVDGLDEPRSSVVRFSGGRVMMIQQYVFQPTVVAHVDIFKIPNLRVSPIFVSQGFVDRWTSAKLKGLEFKKVWAPD